MILILRLDLNSLVNLVEKLNLIKFFKQAKKLRSTKINCLNFQNFRLPENEASEQTAAERHKEDGLPGDRGAVLVVLVVKLIV